MPIKKKTVKVKKRSRRSQPRTGRYFICSLPGCGVKFYARPSRAAKIEREGKGYHSDTCAYKSREGPRKSCIRPGCPNKAKPPNVYCGQTCYQLIAAQRREFLIVTGE